MSSTVMVPDMGRVTGRSVGVNGCRFSGVVGFRLAAQVLSVNPLDSPSAAIPASGAFRGRDVR